MKEINKRLFGAGMAAVMLASGAAVPASAEGIQQQAAVVSAYTEQLGKLSKPKIVATKKGPSAVKLTWKKVNKATGYKVFMKTKTGWKCKAVVKGGGKLSAKVQGLDSRTEYSFKVQAYKKSKGKTYYSSFSAPVAVTTAYGLGKNNYTCKFYDMRFSSKKWDSDELGEGGLVLTYKGDENIPANSVGIILMAADKPVEYNDMTIEEYIESEEVQKELAEDPSVTFEGYTTLDGKKFAIVDVTNEDNTVLRELLGFTKKSVYSVLAPYSKDNAYGNKIIMNQLKKIDIKK